MNVVIAIEHERKLIYGIVSNISFLLAKFVANML